LAAIPVSPRRKTPNLANHPAAAHSCLP
jgi:hypothetical protein